MEAIIVETQIQKVISIHDSSPIIYLGLLAGCAATTADLAVYPFNNIQVRMQMNGTQGLPNYSSLFDCILKTARTSGYAGFFRGFSSSVLRQFPDSTVRFSVYEGLKRYASKENQQSSSFQNSLYGALCGMIGTLFGTPGEILKVRMINDFSGKEYHGLIDCARKTYRYTGLRGFTRGLDANILRNAIMNGSELSAYDYFKSNLSDSFSLERDSFMHHLVCGTLAGMIGAIATSPAEVIKNRYMNQLKSGKIYKNIMHCTYDIWKNEGGRAFYKGFTPFCLTLIPWAQVFFLGYEQYKSLFLPIMLKY